MDGISSWSESATLLVPAQSTIRVRKKGKAGTHRTRIDLSLRVDRHYRGSRKEENKRAYYFSRDGIDLKIYAEQIVEETESERSVWALWPFAPDLTIGAQSPAYRWCLEHLELPRALHLALGIRPWGERYLVRAPNSDKTHKTDGNSCDCGAPKPCDCMDLAENYQSLERSIVHLHCLRWERQEILDILAKGGAKAILEQARATRHAPDGLLYCSLQGGRDV